MATAVPTEKPRYLAIPAPAATAGGRSRVAACPPAYIDNEARGSHAPRTAKALFARGVPGSYDEKNVLITSK
jgi:hypothetical protein